MDINQITNELDQLFAQEKINEIPQFLESHIEQAKEEGAQDVVLTLYNEIIGFYRETGQYELSIENCHKALELMDKMGIQDTIPYATTLLNAANAHRAAGLLQESLELYNRVRPIYVSLLDEDDMYFASFYNNLSLLYQEMGNFAAAKEQLENALYIVTHNENKQFEVAVTQANLANTCIELGYDDEAKARAEEAIRIFEEIGVDDAHYSAALSALGSLYYMDKDYLNALGVMEKARDCVAKYLGTDNIQYQRLSDNIAIINDKINEPEELTNTAMAVDEKTDLPEPERSAEETKEALEFGSENPVGSEEPAESGYPMESEYSVGSEEPAESGYPMENEYSVGSEEPAESGYSMTDEEPAESEYPMTNEEPAENEYSMANEEPAESEYPMESEKPAESDGSAGSEYFTGSEEPTESGYPMENEYSMANEEPAESGYPMESEKMAESDGSAGSEYFAGREEPVENILPQEIAELLEPGEIPEPEEKPVKTDEPPQIIAPEPELETEIKETIETAVMEQFEEQLAKEPIQPERDKTQNDEEKLADAMVAEVMDEIAIEVDEVIEENNTEEGYTEDITGLELCRRYYEKYGKPMISEKFHAYESLIAVGLVGKGSDCFGFDDEQSRDHDFGPRFVMWVTKMVYDEIGEELQQAYEALPTEFMGVERIETFHGRDRSGVMVIEDFYKNTLGYDLIGALSQISENDSLDKENLNTIKSWLAIHDYALAAAVNGEVFRDDEGVFTKYRNRLMSYYPKAVWYRKAAQTCALFSQSGQYNLPRMRGRGQLVAAELAKAECARQAMKLYYLLNKTYAPHDKWLFKGMPYNSEMTVTDEKGKTWQVSELIEKLCLLPVDNEHETELTTMIESLAVIFANELEKKNMAGQCDLYLDTAANELTAKSDALLTAIVADTPVITALSLSIAKAEFEAFDKVQNEGGRASCQNNWQTFKIMRMSQYMTWSEDMLLQYLYDFKTNYEHGRNMIEEKYARMMESTAPQEYAQFADKLPAISKEKKEIMEQIIALQLNWMEEFAAQYPNLAENARAIHTSDDLPYDTSYETYLRGELGTYSDRMLEMYGRYIAEYAQNEKNVTCAIMENTIRFYGYKDLETANQKMTV